MNVSGFDIKGEYDLAFAKQLAQFVKKHNIDIVFIHNSKSHTLAVLSHLLYKLNTPLVLCRTLIKRVDTNFLRKWKYNYRYGLFKYTFVLSSPNWSNPFYSVFVLTVLFLYSGPVL